MRLAQCCFAANFLFICIGLAGVVAAFAKSFPANLNAIAIGLPLSASLVWLGLKIASQRWFLFYLASLWLLSRALVVAAFPHYFLPGDEAFFHSFVAKLVTALPAGTVASLSNIYDYPVWISRAFPFYLPLALWFGPNDLIAARCMNVVLGAAQLLVLFFIVRMLAGIRLARLTCLLFLVFPYHWINVLSYDPQIAGTFFLLIAVLAFVCLLRHRQRPLAALLMGIALGLSLLLAGIQRGGIDILLVGVIFLAVFFSLSTRRNLTVIAMAVALVWLPSRLAFSHWISSYDGYHLRSHTLGFLTRGWNLETSGEYLSLYEQLDVVSPKPEKDRMLAAVLITEFARQPVRALLVLPVVKVAKLFALGYASTAETGLEEGGYLAAANAYRGLRSLYAPIILALSVYGLWRSVTHRKMLRRFLLPVLLISLSGLGIVLLWETSPRYSHPFQFAILMLAAFGIACLPAKEEKWKSSAQTLARQSLLLATCWLVFSLSVAAACRLYKPLHFLDPRSLKVTVDFKPASFVPLHWLTQSWEDAISIPAGTPLPTSIKIALPEPDSVHLWLLNSDTIQVPGVPSAASGRIARFDGQSVSLQVTAKDGSHFVESPIAIGLGFVLDQ